MERTQPFRFLDLPSEIRLLIYERIPVETQSKVLQKRYYCPITVVAGDFSYTLIVKSVPLDILRICRQIYNEALPVMQLKVVEIFAQPPKLIVSAKHLEYMNYALGPVYHAFEFRKAVDEKQFSSFDEHWSYTMRSSQPRRADVRRTPSYQLDPDLERFINKAMFHTIQRRLIAEESGDDPIPSVLEVAVTAKSGDVPKRIGTHIKKFVQSVHRFKGDWIVAIRTARHMFPTMTDDDERRCIEAKVVGPAATENEDQQHCEAVYGGPIEWAEWQDEWVDGEHYHEDVRDAASDHFEKAELYVDQIAERSLLGTDDKASDEEDWGMEDGLWDLDLSMPEIDEALMALLA